MFCLYALNEIKFNAERFILEAVVNHLGIADCCFFKST
jgi:hypothetical protein